MIFDKGVLWSESENLKNVHINHISWELSFAIEHNDKRSTQEQVIFTGSTRARYSMLAFVIERIPGHECGQANDLESMGFIRMKCKGNLQIRAMNADEKAKSARTKASE